MPAATPAEAARATTSAASWDLATRAFVLGIAGLPVWWLLGVAELVPLVVGAILAWDLQSRRRLVLPPGAGWWLLFLGWVALGVGVLWVTAPGAVADGGAARLVVFGYRLAWYLACSSVLLWIGNSSRERLPDRLVHRLVAWLFIVAVSGGLLGVMAPDLVIPTAMEQVLPHGLRSNSFVSSLVSAEAADVQSVLGEPEPRPKAPFAFTNTWGSMIALSLVFFLAWASAARLGRRIALPVLAVAIVPIAFSLNRGLWITLAAGGLGLLFLLAVRRGPAAAGGLAALLLVAGLVLSQSPLATIYTARVDNPHSNERRAQLLEATVDSVTRGSPVVGFGSTRDVQGSFESIAGGATPDCPACGVPPLGTQGQLWLVVFSQGWPGLAFFLLFLLLALARSWRCRTTNQVVATFAIAFFLIELPVYDTLGLPLMVVMVAIGLAWRESRAQGLPRATAGTVLRRPSNAELAVVAAAVVAGAVGGLAAAVVTEKPTETSKVTVELTPSPTYLDVGATARDLASGRIDQVEDARPTTIDTEAALMQSQDALVRAGRSVGRSPATLRSAVSLTAAPLSNVVELSVHTPAAEDSGAWAYAVAESYLAERRKFLERQREDLVHQLRLRLQALDTADPATAEVRTYLRAAIAHLSAHEPEVGQVVRRKPTQPTPAAWRVWSTSGTALGLLFGAGAVRVRRRLSRRSC